VALRRLVNRPANDIFAATPRSADHRTADRRDRRTAGYSVNTGYLLTSSNEIVIQYPLLMNIPTFRPFIHKAGVTPGQSGAGSHSYPRHGYPVPTFV